MAMICNSDEISLKSFFVGPQAENEEILRANIQLVVENWIDWRKNFFPDDGVAISNEDRVNPEFIKKMEKMKREVETLLKLFSKEIPKFSPRYLGHMFSEISLPSIIGHTIALLHNPNNISKESSWVGTDIEKMAIKELSKMVDYPDQAIGHFTSGGTLANFEAILRSKFKITNSIVADPQVDFNDACYTRSGQSTSSTVLSDIDLYKFVREKYQIDFQGHVLLVPDSQHYSWTKGASLFSIGSKNLIKLPLNKFGQLCPKGLKKVIDDCLIEKRPISCITSILGTTELGTIDPIDEIQEVVDSYKTSYGYNLWHHIDAAYGGFFACARGNPCFDLAVQRSLSAIRSSTSITIDPHKLGYVPYSAGVFLCRSAEDYYIHKTVAPYVNFDAKMDLGPYTIEGSRSATGAVALYLASRCIGLDNQGYGRILERTIASTKKLRSAAQGPHSSFLFVDTVGTNIACFAIGNEGQSLTDLNQQTARFLEKAIKNHASPNENIFFISKTHLSQNYRRLIEQFCLGSKIEMDADELHLARLTIMNPFIDSVNSKVDYIESFVEYIQSLCP
jgi:glutamate/tyrosine decarboxylase-like PLP-dependent enzyme